MSLPFVLRRYAIGAVIIFVLGVHLGLTPTLPSVQALAPERDWVAMGTDEPDSNGLGVSFLADARLLIEVDRAQYRPGEPVRITVRLAPERADQTVFDEVVVDVYRLANQAASLRQPSGDGATWTFEWTPPRESAGYGVRAALLSGGAEVAWSESAFDVAHAWTDHPRYGFVSEFGAWDEEAALAQFRLMNRLHLNGVQFYDWMYKHESLVPQTETFVDSLGRELQVASIEGKIRLARSHGMAPMAYTAIYAASPEYFERNRDWALYDDKGKPIPFADGYLYLMNPACGSEWREHLMDEFIKALGRFNFEGIHIDQYGFPKVAHTRAGHTVILSTAFRDFINDAKDRLKTRFERNSLTFNSVTNWPTAVVGRSNYDFNYIEVWPPYTTYGDIEMILRDAYQSSNGKPTVIAAYIDPRFEATARLLNALIAANGGTHIEMGEGDGMLADPYFPKFQRVSPALWSALVAHYDFIVRYRELLYEPRWYQGVRDRVLVNGERVAERPEPGKVHGVLHQSQSTMRQVLSLINFTSASTVDWREAQSSPEALEDVEVSVVVDALPKAVWWASPDAPTLSLQPLEARVIHQDQLRVELTIPRIEYWSVVVLEY